ncbi:MAG: ATP-dependent 6-phosphofructokinase [Nitrospirota bacterium]|nr:ATP-dependent 6-phosphofructokinase [Nitrospirota bacterium]
MRIGILTGGGDCPGLNAVLRAVVRRADKYGFHVTGIRDGWKGLLEPDTYHLDAEAVSGILHLGGTILGTSRTNPFAKPENEKKLLENIKLLDLEVIMGVGGDDTLGVLNKLSGHGIKTIGIPKTIDNDLMGTDFTFGFYTAVDRVTAAIDNLHSTSEAHHRVMVVEIMGRHAGWITAFGGLAGGADLILVPEKKFKIEEVCESIKRRFAKGRKFFIIAASEGAKPDESEALITKTTKRDAFGNVMLGGIGEMLAEKIEEKTGFETRHVVLGHLQRGGSPSAYDRILGTRYGIKAADLVHEGKFGRMVALHGTEIVDIPLSEGVMAGGEKQYKLLDMAYMELAETFFA